MSPGDPDRETLDRLLGRLRREHVEAGAFVDPAIQKVFEARGLHLTTTHGYSPAADAAACLAAADAEPIDAETLFGVDYDEQAILQDRLLQHAGGLAGLPRDAVDAAGAAWPFFWNNPMLPPLDVATLHGFVTGLRPPRIVELGGGFSTAIAARAAAANPSPTDHLVIEPYPSRVLHAAVAAAAGAVRLDPRPAQAAGPGVVDTLHDGDLLYVDTTHVLKPGSEVAHVLIELLPRLRPGVWVHFHDVFLPRGYPAAWTTEIGIQWNEQQAIAAVLANSDRFGVRLMNAELAHRRPEALRAALAGLPIDGLDANLGGHRGTGLWLRRRGSVGA